MTGLLEKASGSVLELIQYVCIGLLLPTVTTRFPRLRVFKGGPWGDASDIARWRVYCAGAAP